MNLLNYLATDKKPDAVGKQLTRLTVMLTESCNLDCWMCDFRISQGAKKRLAWSPKQLSENLALLKLDSGLRSIVFTGGEPFAHPQVVDYVEELRKNYPKLTIYFSSNCTLPKKMHAVYEKFEDQKNCGLLVSIDGIDCHDIQRGKEGSYVKTMVNLKELRARFPKLPIILKFTITPVNYYEIFKTWERVTEEGFLITFKLLEFNPYYTNKYNSDIDQFQFSEEQTEECRQQLKQVLKQMKQSASRARAAEIREVLASLEESWTRSGRCAVPVSDGFLDCDLNFFTCKEYAPVANLSTDSLSAPDTLEKAAQIVQAEACNTQKCTHCTSQMKRPASAANLLRSVFQ